MQKRYLLTLYLIHFSYNIYISFWIGNNFWEISEMWSLSCCILFYERCLLSFEKWPFICCYTLWRGCSGIISLSLNLYIFFERNNLKMNDRFSFSLISYFLLLCRPYEDTNILITNNLAWIINYYFAKFYSIKDCAWRRVADQYVPLINYSFLIFNFNITLTILHSCTSYFS